MGLLLRSATLSSGSSCAGVRLTGPLTADVRVDGECVAWIDPPGTLSPAPGDAVHDLAGYLLLPAPVEPHAHLDGALLDDQVPNPAADLPGARAAMHAAAPGITRQDVLRRARRAAQLYLAHGATAVRSHVDVGGGFGLRNLEALLQLREELRGLLALQLVALPVPLTNGASTAKNLPLLREALAMGADLVGGSPLLDDDPCQALDVSLEAASEAGVGVDLHLDEPAQSAAATLEALAGRIAGSGFRYPVTAAYCSGADGRSPTDVARLADAVAAAGISVVALPQAGLFRTGREHGVGASRALAGLGSLLAAGVTVAAGGDHLRDPFHPMGRADPLETASLLVTAGHLAPDQAYTAVTSAARAVMGLAPVPARGVLNNGVPAELLAIRATSLADALAAADPDRTVITAGRVAVRTRVTKSFPLFR